MKSRITIDVDHYNQPVIKIEYQSSDDVRDKLVQRFLQEFGGDSTFANFYYTGSQDNGGRSAEIRPIGPEYSKELNTVFYKEKVSKNKDE